MGFLNYIISINKRENPVKLTERTFINSEMDYAFFNTLQEKDKLTILRRIRGKIIFLDISKQIIKEGKLLYLHNLLTSCSFFDYCIKTNRIDELKNFLQLPNTKEYYSNLNCCHIIIPRFKTLYEIAYSDTEYDPKKNPEYSKVLDAHAMLLIKNKCVDELKFMKQKKWHINKEVGKEIMKSFHRPIINLLNQKGITILMDDMILTELSYTFIDLVEMGFRPSINGVANAFINDFCDFNDNLDIIDFLPKDIYLDRLKAPLCHGHPELIPEFIRRYGDRLSDTCLNSWEVEKSYSLKKFRKACDVLDLNYRNYVNKLFKNAFKELIYDGKKKQLVIDCAFYCKDNINLNVPSYLEYVIIKNDLKLARVLLDAGANMNIVKNWEKKCSWSMYTVIKAHSTHQD